MSELTNFPHLLRLLEEGEYSVIEMELSKNIEIFSKDLRYLNLYCLVLSKLDRISEATAHFMLQYETYKNNVVYLQNLSAFLFQKGDYREALQYIQKAYAANSEIPAIVENLTAIYLKLEEFKEVDNILYDWEKRHEMTPQMCFNRALSFQERKMYQDALKLYQKTLSLQRNHASARTNAIVCANRLRLYDIALSLSDVDENSDDKIQYNRAQTLWLSGDYEKAYDVFKLCANYVRNSPDAFSEWLRFLNEGGFHKDLDNIEFGKFEKSVKTLVAESSLLKEIGELDKAKQKLTSAKVLVDAYPTITQELQTVITNSCLLSNFYIRDGKSLFDFHQKEMESFNKFFSEKSMAKSHSANLKIGFVSSDFKDHSVSFFLLPLLEKLIELPVKVILYSNQRTEDARTAKFKALPLKWSNISNMDDAAAIELIQGDDIDVLVDLSGHTGGNRLSIFAQRAAPLQISWLGYPATTACINMDYKITDKFCDPKGSEQYYSEKILRMPNILFCYNNDVDYPIDSSPPSAKREYVTFGSFNNFSKINEQVLDVWFNILKKQKGSRLLLKNKAYASQHVQQLLNQYLRKYGISGDRVICHLYSPAKYDHMQLYNEIDIALDTFPYSGATTTCEALWMGVPVVTMPGQTHVSRVSGSILDVIGLQDLICTDTQNYVDIALGLAQNKRRLYELKRSMRSTIRGSKLGNSELFAKDFMRLLLEKIK